MIWVIAALAWIEAQAAGISPVLDHAYRYISDDTRQVAGRPRHFTAERRILFHREGDTLVADVTLDRLSTDAPGEVGRRFLAGAGGLKGRTVRFRLTPDGSVASIDDEPAVWAAMLAGIGSIAATARSTAARDPATGMAALPPERRRAVIGSIVGGLFVAPASVPRTGRRAVTLPARALTGEPVILPGEETTGPVVGGLVRIATEAANGETRLVRTRMIDPVTGLLASEQEQVFATVAGRLSLITSNRRSMSLVS